MRTATIFQIVSAILLAVAAYFYWRSNDDAVFFSLVLSACSFFLSIRAQAKDRLANHQRETLSDQEDQ